MKYYITTTLPYVNAKPHIGFALEIVQADVLARYHKLLGDEVIFNTGVDEHGIKIWQKAKEEGKDVQNYVDEYAFKFGELKESLNLSYTNFIRTTDENHIKAAQKFWKLCEQNGDIYKKNYQTKYCVGCELEKTDSELENGHCPVHPNLELELINEENYFFRFSKYSEKLLKFYENNPDFVVPGHRLNEIKEFVKRGLQDFSVSRLKTKMPWGVPVPGDESQVMYVWFDALVNYISTLGWPDDKNDFENFWPGFQVAGKDNLRQQTAMWQAMLMSAGLPNTEQVFIHGFITSGGQKMSKSLGNVVDPFVVQEKYGADALRYFLLGGLSSFEDGDFTYERFEEFYTAHLVNGVGNLTSRILTMLEKYSNSQIPLNSINKKNISDNWWNTIYKSRFNSYDFSDLVFQIDVLISYHDDLITKTEPWKKAKNGDDISDLLCQLAEGLRQIGLALLPIIPQTGEKILTALGIDIKDKTLEDLEAEKIIGNKIIKPEILFPRLEK